MLLEAEQSHSLNVTKGSSIATKWNFIQSQTLALHPTARDKGLGQCSIPRAPWSWAVQVTGCEPEPFLAYSLRPRVAAAVAWPLPMLGAWLCAPIPFLTELYKGLLKKKKYKQSALKKGRTLETVQNMENTIPATGVEGEGRGQLGAYRTS